MENKFPGSNRTTKEYFWEEIKTLLEAYIYARFQKQELSSLEKSALIEIIEKRIQARDLLKIGELYPFLIQVSRLCLKYLQPDIKMYYLLFHLIKQRVLKID